VPFKEYGTAEMPVLSLTLDSVRDRELSFWMALPDKLQAATDHTWPYGAIYLHYALRRIKKRDALFTRRARMI
jgi:hypothetical protein